MTHGIGWSVGAAKFHDESQPPLSLTSWRRQSAPENMRHRDGDLRRIRSGGEKGFVIRNDETKKKHENIEGLPSQRERRA